MKNLRLTYSISSTPIPNWNTSATTLCCAKTTLSVFLTGRNEACPALVIYVFPAIFLCPVSCFVQALLRDFSAARRRVLFCFAACVFLQDLSIVQRRSLRPSGLGLPRKSLKEKQPLYQLQDFRVTHRRKHCALLGAGPSHRFARCAPNDFRDGPKGDFRT